MQSSTTTVETTSSKEMPNRKRRPASSKSEPLAKASKAEKTMVDLVARIDERSNVSANAIEKLTQFINEDAEENIFNFLSKKFSSFKKTTQNWLEDEAMKLYMEAKRRDQTEVPYATNPDNRLRSYNMNYEQPHTFSSEDIYRWLRARTRYLQKSDIYTSTSF